MNWLKTIFLQTKNGSSHRLALCLCGQWRYRTIEKSFGIKTKLRSKRCPRKNSIVLGNRIWSNRLFELLLESGANPNAQDQDGVTCLNIAKSSSGLTEFSDALFRFNVDPTIKDKHGKLYLM